MKKRNSLLKTSLLAIGTLEAINRIIDSSSVAGSVNKTGGKYYNWKHGNIYYRTFGDKTNPPLLLIHDLNVFSSNYEWLETAKSLSDRYYIYCIDLIGCGKSEKPGITYTNFFYVQMITDFVREVIGKTVDVAATGLSGSFVLMANALDQKLFNQIMLVSPTPVSTLKRTPDDRSKILMKLFEIPVIGRTLYYILTNRSNTEYYLTEHCIYNSFHMKQSLVKAYYDAAHTHRSNGKYLLASLQSNYVYADITRALKNAQNRIVLVVGEQNENAAALVESYQSIQPDLVVEWISDAKLLPQLESNREMLELMHHF